MYLFFFCIFSLCSDDNIKNTDIHCWTGDHVGDYSYTMLMPGGAQKYNPEVPLAKDQLQDSVILHELVDRLFKISSRIGTNVSFYCSHILLNVRFIVVSDNTLF